MTNSLRFLDLGQSTFEMSELQSGQTWSKFTTEVLFIVLCSHDKSQTQPDHSLQRKLSGSYKTDNDNLVLLLFVTRRRETACRS